MVTPTVIICAGQPQSPRGVLCLSGQFRALCSAFSFSYKEAGALLSVCPGRFLLQRGCWDSSAGLAQPQFWVFLSSSSSRSGIWAIGLFLPDELVGNFVAGFPGSEVKPDCCFFWVRCILKHKAGFCEIGLLVLASLAVLGPCFSLQKSQEFLFCGEHTEGGAFCWCVDDVLAALFPKQPARPRGAINPTGICQIICSST